MRRVIQLGNLIAGYPLDIPLPPNITDRPVCGLTQNSRTVQPGELYIALPGLTGHGLDYLTEVVAHEAIAVLTEPNTQWPQDRINALRKTVPIAIISSPGLSQHLVALAKCYYTDHAAEMRIIGITGTNGKTSVAHYLAQALEILQPGSVGVIGTLGNGRLQDLRSTQHTTPDLLSLYAELARQREMGIRQVVMEVSSHALEQGRIAGLRIETALFTNLTRDHQDYHGNMAAYGAAKAKLFQTPDLAHAVIQADDPFGQQLINQLAKNETIKVTEISTNNKTQLNSTHSIQATRIQTSPTGLHIDLQTSAGNGQINSPLRGRFNADNLILALGALRQQQIPLAEAIIALSQVEGVPGRMTHRGGAGQPQVLIDYAHTPDALEKVLQAAREHTKGRLISVFGCGGNRDQGKRPLMGAIAERLTEQVWITDDNPRHENPTEITEQILAGMHQPNQVQLEHSRAKAITEAIAQAQPDDMIVVAGKGHETQQQIGEQQLPFSDIEQVEKALHIRPIQ